MKIYSTMVLWILCIFTNQVNAQDFTSSLGKNTPGIIVGFSNSIVFSHIDLGESLYKALNDFKYFLDASPANKMILTSNWNARFGFSLFKSSDILLYFGRTTYGFQSDIFYIPKTAGVNNGGSRYKYVNSISEISLIYRYTFKLKKTKIQPSISIGGLLGLHDNARFNTFVLTESQGLLRTGCCYARWYANNRPYFERLKLNYNQGHFRGGILFSAGVNVPVWRGLSFRHEISANFIGPYFKKTGLIKGAFVQDGRILSLTFSTGLEYNFTLGNL